jgi:hypothetical protein
MISVLRTIFSRNGLPEKVCTYNGKLENLIYAIQPFALSSSHEYLNRDVCKDIQKVNQCNGTAEHNTATPDKQLPFC